MSARFCTISRNVPIIRQILYFISCGIESPGVEYNEARSVLFWLRQELSKLLCVSVRLYGRELFRIINPHSAQNLHDGFRI